jgi:hypothetical protein
MVRLRRKAGAIERNRREAARQLEFGHSRPGMSNDNNTGVLEDEAGGNNEPERRRSFTGYGIFGAALVVLVIGTTQVLSANSEREVQARKVRDAQAKMEILN